MKVTSTIRKPLEHAHLSERLGDAPRAVALLAGNALLINQWDTQYREDPQHSDDHKQEARELFSYVQNYTPLLRGKVRQGDLHPLTAWLPDPTGITQKMSSASTSGAGHAESPPQQSAG